jgi:hypothetical protein
MIQPFARLKMAESHAATSQNNDRRDPTPAQALAGNYKTGRIVIHGLSLKLENVRNSIRTGKSEDGKVWANRLAASYGEISGTTGADGDPVDVFVGLFPESRKVWIINQGTSAGAFDEHKCMLGFANEQQARDAYLMSFDRGWTGLLSMVHCTIEQFRWWLANGDMSRPFSLDQLPFDGSKSMNKTLWTADAQPLNTPLHKLMYELRVEDGSAGLMLDAVTMADILGDPDIQSVPVLDALVVEVNRMTVKMTLLQKVMEAAGVVVKPTGYQISDPVKLRGVLQVAVLFTLSDGQTVTVWFHNPDTTPAKLMPMDELISWKWMLNKKDITIVVAPEKGKDLNVREVARRIMRLAERNTEAFAKANGKLSERLASEAAIDGEIVALTSELASLQTKIEVAKVSKADAAQAADRRVRDVTTPEGYAAISGSEELLLAHQDTLDSFFQGRIVAVRNALRELGWDGERFNPLSKEGITLEVKYKQVGAGSNIVGLHFELAGVTGFYMSDTLELTPVELAARIDLGLPVASEPDANIGRTWGEGDSKRTILGVFKQDGSPKNGAYIVSGAKLPAGSSFSQLPDNLVMPEDLEAFIAEDLGGVDASGGAVKSKPPGFDSQIISKGVSQEFIEACEKTIPSIDRLRAMGIPVARREYVSKIEKVITSKDSDKVTAKAVVVIDYFTPTDGFSFYNGANLIYGGELGTNWAVMARFNSSENLPSIPESVSKAMTGPLITSNPMELDDLRRYARSGMIETKSIYLGTVQNEKIYEVFAPVGFDFIDYQNKSRKEVVIKELIDAGFKQVQSNDYSRTTAIRDQKAQFNIRVVGGGTTQRFNVGLSMVFPSGITGGKVEMGGTDTPAEALALIDREIARRSEPTEAEQAIIDADAAFKANQDRLAATTGTPLDAFEAADGESWQVTRAKWVEIMQGHFAFLGQTGDAVDFEEAHRGAVKTALDAGKPVPAEVLADYPGIFAETEAQKAARYAATEANLNKLMATASGEGLATRVDAAYLFTNATDAFKAEVADSIEKEDYSPFATAKAMDEAAKAAGATIAWSVGMAVLDGAEPDDCKAPGEDLDEEDFDADAEWAVTPEQEVEDQLLDGDHPGHAFRGNGAVSAGHESRSAVGSSMRAKGAEKRGDAKAAKSAHKAAHYAHKAALVTATGITRKYHKTMADFHGKRGGSSKVLDSVPLLDAAEKFQTIIGKIKKGATIIGRAMIGDDGKAMVYVGKTGTERVTYASSVDGERRKAMWSDDDAALMVGWLLQSVAAPVQASTVAAGGKENQVWSEKEIGYSPNRPADKPFKLVSKDESFGIASAFGEKPKMGDMLQYFASPEDAESWASSNGYAYIEDPSVTAKTETPTAAIFAALTALGWDTSTPGFASKTIGGGYTGGMMNKAGDRRMFATISCPVVTVKFGDTVMFNEMIAVGEDAATVAKRVDDKMNAMDPRQAAAPAPASDSKETMTEKPKGDISYRAKDDMFTAFYPDSAAGEDAWRVMAMNPDSVNGVVLTKHVASVVAQLRAAGYTVTEAPAPEKMTAEEEAAMMAELEAPETVVSNEIIADLTQPADPAPTTPAAVDPQLAADRAYIESLIDGTGDLLAEDTYDKLEPLFARYESDADMTALLEKAATIYGDAAVAAAQQALAPA